MSNITTTTSKIPAHLQEFFKEKRGVPKPRIIFILDATASRQETWDRASGYTAQMFSAAAAGAMVEMQLVYFRGSNECTASRWLSSAAELSRAMSKIMCRSGHTQFERALKHIAKEDRREKVAAAIVISDCFEETPSKVYAVARELNVPLFMFQEGDNEKATPAYAELARLTKGASCQFDNSSAARLADLLRAVVAFATGGIKALSDQNNAAARLLLTQLKK